MALPNHFRRWLRFCALVGWRGFIGSTFIGATLSFASDHYPTAEAEIDWYIPPENTTQPVVAELVAPGESSPETWRQPPSQLPQTSPILGPVETPPVVNLHRVEGRFETLSGGELGMDSVDGSATLQFAELDQFSISPRAGVMFVDGPTRTDLPARLYSGQVEFRWFQDWEPFFLDLAVIPGLFTDGDATGSQAFRLQGRAVGYLAFSEETQVALGATYLDRDDVPLLPIVGLIHSPREDIRIEAMFPRPRLLKRIAEDSAGETWAYLQGELGGGSWAIERPGRWGRNRIDIASYRDYRLIAGIERRVTEGGSALLEAGYVFGRELTYESGRGDYDPEGTFLIRCGLTH